MTKRVYGDIQLQDASSLFFADSDSSNTVALLAPATITTNFSLTLPTADSTGTQALVSNGSGALSFADFLDDTLTDSFIFVGNASNVATGVAVTGDISISNTGVTAISSGVIVDADVNASAAITLTKLAATTASRALVSDASGFITASAATSTEVGYLSGVTSAIQTQLDGKASTALDNLASVAINTSLISDTDNTDDLGSAAIGWANAYANILHMDSNSQTTAIKGSAAATASVTYSLPPADGTSGYVLSTNGSGTLSWVANEASSSFADDWETADGTSLAVAHNLGTKDVMVQIYDKSDDQTIEVDTITRTDTNTVTLTSSSAPGASGWRVLVLAI